jgi:hypothetical protein
MVIQSKPITPEQAKEKFTKRIPDIIIDAINELIVEHYSPIKRSATVKQDEILDRISDTYSRRTVFDNNWLDIEDIYREQGWRVRYESPSYGDSDFDAYFEFSEKK